MNLKVIRTPKEEKNYLEIFVEAPSQIADKSYFLALKHISEHIDVPGFRKGKAPREVVEKKVGVGYISQKAFESIFYEVLNTASAQEKLDIVNIPEITSYELLPGKPLTFKAVVELKPEVKLGKYKSLKVKTKKVVYDKEKFIEKTLEKISQNFISFKTITDREVKEGDLVNIDFEGKFEDGSEVPGGKAENFQAFLEKDKFLPEFIEKLKGVQIGDLKEVEVVFPNNPPGAFAGKKASFKVKVNSIEEKILPEIDDDFAKKIGMKDFNDLKDKILDQMKELQDTGSQREFENKLVEQIIQNSKHEISSSMIEREVDFLLKDFKAKCEQQGVKWTDYKSDEKNKELIAKAREASINRINIDLVLNAIVKEEGIVASDDEINSEIAKRMSELGEKYKHLEHDKSFKNTVELIVLRNKTIDFLVKYNEPLWEGEVTTLHE